MLYVQEGEEEKINSGFLLKTKNRRGNTHDLAHQVEPQHQQSAHAIHVSTVNVVLRWD